MAIPTNIEFAVSPTFPAQVSATVPISVSKVGGVWSFTFNAANMALNSLPLDKIEQVATGRLLGRDTAGTGNVETLTVSGGIEFTGSGGIQTGAFTGEVTKAAGGTALTLAANVVTTPKINDGAVTDAKLASARLQEISGLAVTNGNIIVGDGSGWTAESGATARTSLGLTIGTDVQAYSARLAEIVGLTPTDSNVIVGDGSAWVAESGSTVRASLGLAIGTDVQAFQAAQATAIWEAGAGTTESVVSPAKIAAAITALESGNTSWTAHVISATDASWAVPAGTREMFLYVWGAGGSGAGGNVNGAGQRGSGGGGGEFRVLHYSGTMDATLNITIGAGGAVVASVAGGANGNAGGATSVVGTNLGTVSATGGGGGQANVASGGGGGTGGSGGDYSIPGGDGRTSSSGLPNNFVYEGGDAGGWGGPGGKSNVGTAGKTPGGGGSCGNHTVASDSGAGAPGQVIILTRG